MDLRIDQQFGKIGLDIKKPSYYMDIQHPQIDLEIDPPQLQMNQRLPRIEIDQTQCFADMGRRTPVAFTQHMAEMNHLAGFQVIARIAGEGDMLALIEKGIDVADIALMNSQDQDEFDVAAVPEHRPVIEAIAGELHIALDAGDVEGKLRSGQVSGQLDWGRVKVFWRQKPFIDIKYVGQRLDVNA